MNALLATLSLEQSALHSHHVKLTTFNKRSADGLSLFPLSSVLSTVTKFHRPRGRGPMQWHIHC